MKHAVQTARVEVSRASIHPFHHRAAAWLGALGLALFAGHASAAGGAPKATTATFSPASVTLNTAVGSSSSVTVSVFDATSALLTIGTANVSGPQAGEYTIGGTCVPGATVDRSKAPCTVSIAFSPAALGTRSATLNVTFANAPAIAVPLNGIGIPATPTTPQIRVDNLPLGTADFGQRAVAPGTQPPNVPLAPDLLLLISDTGGSNLLQSETIIGANPADFNLNGFVGGNLQTLCVAIPIINPQNLPCRLGISFAPTALGTRTAIVRITSNDPNRPTIDIPLSGVGIPGVVAASSSVVSFADITGLWGTPTETGWALNIAHNKSGTAVNGATDAVLAWWETFDTTGQAVWFQLRDGQWTDAQTWTGNVHRFTGSPFTGAYLQSQLVDTVVGTATMSFTTPTNGTLGFTINGFSGTKTITRNPIVF